MIPRMEHGKGGAPWVRTPRFATPIRRGLAPVIQALMGVLSISAGARAQSLLPQADAGALPGDKLGSSRGLSGLTGRGLDAGKVAEGVFAYPVEIEATRAIVRLIGPELDLVTAVRVRKSDAPLSAERTLKRTKDLASRRGVLDVHFGEGGELSFPEPLVTNTRYAYVVESKSGNASGEFVTAPPPDTDVHFLAYGDNRTDPVSHRRVVEAMLKRPRDLLIHTGDYVEVGSRDADWGAFFAVERELLASRYLVGSVGNHELIEPGGGNFLRYFAKADVDPTSLHVEQRGFVRTVRWGRAHFFLFNGMDEGGTAEERVWLEKELDRSIADAPSAFRIVALHHSPWSSGPHGANKKLYTSGIVDLLVAKKLDILFAGHDHLYERGSAKGIPYIISGGGGAPLYAIKHRIPEAERAESVHHFVDVAVTEGRISIEAVREDSSTLEKCSLIKGAARWECEGVPPKPETPSEPSKIPKDGVKEEPRGIDPAVWVFGVIVTLGLGLALFSRRKKGLPVSDKSDNNPRQ